MLKKNFVVSSRKSSNVPQATTLKVNSLCGNSVTELNYRAAKLMNTNADVNVELRETMKVSLEFYIMRGAICNIHAADHHLEEASDNEDAIVESESADQFVQMLYSIQQKYQNVDTKTRWIYYMHFYYMLHYAFLLHAKLI